MPILWAATRSSADVLLAAPHLYVWECPHRTTSDKPSIAELQQLAPRAIDVNSSDDDWFGSREAIVAAAPVLIEIVAAALAAEETGRAAG